MIEYIPAKTIVTRMKKPGEWFGADYNMNIYKGCCHGCIYCDSRSECYGIQEFDKVMAKEDALRIIRDDLRRKVKRGVVATGVILTIPMKRNCFLPGMPWNCAMRLNSALPSPRRAAC